MFLIPEMQDSQQTIKAISTICQNQFRRTSSKTIQNLALNVYLVLVGLKPAYLLDQNPFSSKDDIETKLTLLDRLVRDISTKFTSKKLLCAISIREEDIIIINTKFILSNLDDKNTLFVDISSDLEEPKVITDQVAMTFINQMVSSTIIQLKSKTQTCSFQLQTEATWNISTLFGILLNYPVVYYYSDFSDCTNCLGHIDLYSHKLLLHLEDQTDPKLIYSFTYPVKLREMCSAKTEMWTQKLKQQFPSCRFTLDTITVNLDVVLL